MTSYYKIGYGDSPKGDLTSLEDSEEVRKTIKEKGGEESWARWVYLFVEEDRERRYYVFPEARINCSDPDFSVLGFTLDDAIDTMIERLAEDWYQRLYLNKK